MSAAVGIAFFVAKNEEVSHLFHLFLLLNCLLAYGCGCSCCCCSFQVHKEAEHRFKKVSFGFVCFYFQIVSNFCCCSPVVLVSIPLTGPLAATPNNDEESHQQR